MKSVVETDIAIIGGGVAGLWLLNRLRADGYSAILLESQQLGSGQTHKAQGIIHGGMKYALQGMLTNAANAISAMPALWHACLNGQGEIDLRQVTVLSNQQYLWSTGSFASKLAGKMAGFTLKSHMQALTKDAYPAIFQHADFKGQVYSLDEIVLDTHSLVRELVKLHQDAIFKIDPMQESDIELDEQQKIAALHIHAAPLASATIKAKHYVFTAGSGNQLLLNQLNNPAVSMQKRPLQMTVVKHAIAEPLFAHCLGLGATPRITITSHRAHDGKFIWYIGGQIAEEGVARSPAEQINAVRSELNTLFPWLSLNDAHYATFFIDRAEGLQANGTRPDSFMLHCLQNYSVAWPTKLALAPALANQISAQIKQTLKPGPMNIRALHAWPMPVIATPIWDQLLC